jgi:putrescine transport system permease protein
MTKVSKINLTFLIFGYALLYLPIALVIISSFSSSEVPGVWTGFSTHWFLEAFKDADLLGAVVTSLEIATVSATLSVVLGIISATITTRMVRSQWASILKNAVIMPVIMPDVIIGFSVLMLFIAMRDIISLPSGGVMIVVGHVVLAMGYVHVMLRSNFLHFDRSLEEAAMNLGARPLSVFWLIKMPLMKRSVLAGWLLAFTLSLDDVVIASFLSGPGSTTLPILIFSSVRLGVSPAINALTTIFFAVTALFILTAYIVTGRPSSKRGGPPLLN